MAQLVGQWKLEKAAGQDITFPTEVQFSDEGRVSWKYGNNFFGQFTTDGHNIKLGPFASTKMFFPQNPPEHIVAQAFEQSTSWVISGNTLTLSHDSEVKVVLTKV